MLRLFQLLRHKHLPVAYLMAIFIAAASVVLLVSKPTNNTTVHNTKKLANSITQTATSHKKTASPSQNSAGAQLPATSQNLPTQTTDASNQSTEPSPVRTATIVSPPASVPQPTPTPPPVQQGFDLTVDPSQITSDSTGYYFPFQVIRKGGFAGKITPSGVTIDPQGTWPNYIQFEEIFMLSSEKGAFILIPQMSHAQDVTITVMAFSYPYQASYSFQYHFPGSYY